jgi:hypothetical protein
MPTPDMLPTSRLESFRTLKVKHPRLEEVERFLLRAISGHRSYTLLDLYGAGGVGKSTVVEQIVRQLRDAETDPAVVPAVIVQASPEDVGSAARLDYYQQVLDQFQHHPAIRDRTKNLPLYINRGKKGNDPAEWLEVRNVVEYALRLFQVKVVFVDEGQHPAFPRSSAQADGAVRLAEARSRIVPMCCTSWWATLICTSTAISTAKQHGECAIIIFLAIIWIIRKSVKNLSALSKACSKTCL